MRFEPSYGCGCIEDQDLDTEETYEFTDATIMATNVALVYDVPGWAFHRMALQLARNAPSKWNFSTYASPERRNMKEFHAQLSKNNQLVHYFSKHTPLFRNGVVSTTSVHSHPNPGERRFVNESLRAREFFVISAELRALYSLKFPGRSIPICYDGVETSTFYPRSTIGVSKTLRLGWVGNSAWGNHDHKGFSGIFLPVIDALRDQGVNVEAKIADATSTNFPYALMPEFYDDIDILLCTSRNEGTPMPILEAGAMKRAWISTRTGIVPEMAGQDQSEFIVERTVDSFVEAIKKLDSDRQLMQSCGEENYNIIRASWGIQRSVDSRVQFFADVLDRSQCPNQ